MLLQGNYHHDNLKYRYATFKYTQKYEPKLYFISSCHKRNDFLQI